MRLFICFFGLALFSTVSFSQQLEVVPQTGHSSIFTMDFSPDSRQIITIGWWDNQVIIWDLAMGKQVKAFHAHEGLINAVHYSPTGDYFLTASEDASIKVWDSKTFELLKTFKGKEAINSAKFDPTGRYIATAGDENSIYIWGLEEGGLVKTFDQPNAYNQTVAFFPGENGLLVSGGNDSSLYVFNIYEDSLVKSFDMGAQILHVEVSKLGYIMATTTDKKYELWDYYFDEYLGSIDCPCNFLTEIICATPDFDDKNFLIGYPNSGGHFTLFEMASNTNVTYDPEYNNFLNAVKFSPDGNYVAVSNWDYQIDLYRIFEWNAEHQEIIREKRFEGFTNNAITLEFHPQGGQLVLGGNVNIDIFDYRNGYEFRTIYGIPFYDTHSMVHHPSGDGLYIIYNGTDLAYYDLTKSGAHRQTSVSDTFLSFIDTDTYGKNVALLNDGNTIILVNGERMEILQKTVPPHLEADIQCLKINPKGEVIAVGDTKGKIQVYDIKLNRWKLLSEEKGRIYSLAFHNERSLLAAGDEDGNIKIWNFETGKLIQHINPTGLGSLTLLFSPDGKRIISGGLDYSVNVWDWENGEEIFSEEVHTSFINEISISPDGKQIASAGQDNIVNILDAVTGEVLVHFYSMKGGQYVAMTPENYYLATPGASDKLIFRAGHKAYSFEQFDLQYNRPHRVLANLGYSPPQLVGAYERAYHKRLQKFGYTESDFSRELHFPTAEILLPDSMRFSVAEPVYLLNIRAWDEKFDLEKVMVWVNDVPVYGMAGMSINSMKDTFYTELPIQLSNRKNKIQVAVVNEKGVESLKQTIELNYDGDYSMDLYLLTLSVSDYADDNFDLQYARKDGEDLIDLLSLQSNYDSIHVISLFDEEATRENFTALKNQLLKTGVKDRVVLFVSGHGLLDESFDFYFATYDFDFNDPSTRGIAYSTIEWLLDSIPSRNKLLLMDACHSGEVDKYELTVADSSLTVDGGKAGLKSYSYKGVKLAYAPQQVGLENSFELMQELFTNLSRGSGTTVISAAAGNSYALESDKWRNGVFTYAIKLGLEEGHADFNNNGYITVGELQGFVTKAVEELTNGLQKPTSRQQNLANDFVIYKVE